MCFEFLSDTPDSTRRLTPDDGPEPTAYRRGYMHGARNTYRNPAAHGYGEAAIAEYENGFADGREDAQQHAAAFDYANGLED